VQKPLKGLVVLVLSRGFQSTAKVRREAGTSSRSVWALGDTAVIQPGVGVFRQATVVCCVQVRMLECAK